MGVVVLELVLLGIQTHYHVLVEQAGDRCPLIVAISGDFGDTIWTSISLKKAAIRL